MTRYTLHRAPRPAYGCGAFAIAVAVIPAAIVSAWFAACEAVARTWNPFG